MASAPPAKRARLDPSLLLPEAAVVDSGTVVDQDFHGLTEISQGSNGAVLYKARHKSGDIVALKRLVHRRWLVQPRNPDRPLVLRLKCVFDESWRTEAECLAACSHPNVVGLQKVAADSTGSMVFLVMDYAYTDLGKLLRARSRPFTEGEAKFLMLQLLRGVKSIHDHGILHGDLKPTHILVDYVGDLKICDFSRSRKWGTPTDDMKKMAMVESATRTLWYMPPELLLGVHKEGSPSNDMWALGCIMAQLMNKEVLIPGTSMADQINKMFQVLGTPNHKDWPEVSTVPRAAEIMRRSKRQWSNLRRLFPAQPFPGLPTLSRDGYHLLRDLLCYDPKKRLTVEAALDHPWFQPSRDGSSGPPAIKPRDIISPIIDYADAVKRPPPAPCHMSKKN